MYRVFAFALALLLAGSAAADVKVVATIGSLGSIAKEVVGSNGSVTVLAPPYQDPHFVDGKPSMILALNKADLLIHVGLGLEVGWLPPLVTGARNSKIQPGQPGNLDGSTIAGQILETGNPADRALGDVHPGGNPHYWYDARRAPGIADAIAARLGQLDPSHAAAYKENAQRFSAALQPKIKGWEAKMAPYRGRSLVPYHKSLVYLENWLGLQELATVEPLPGISPSPSHLANLILQIRSTNPKPVVATEPWYDQRNAEVVAEKSGSQLVKLPGDVGFSPETDTYAKWMDVVIDRVAAGFSK